MIVIGIDPHKGSHTAVAVAAATGQMIASKTVKARHHGHDELVVWARSLGDDRAFAIEDCRHVSGGLERFLLGRGERVVRVAPKLMAGSRRGRSRSRQVRRHRRAQRRSCRCARGDRELPCARLDPGSLEIKLLLDHREDLIAERTRDQNRLRWHLHDLDPDLQIPAGALDRLCWLEKVAKRLARLEQTARVRISRSLVRRLRGLVCECNRLETEIATLIRDHAFERLHVHGCGALTAAKLIAETAGAERFRNEASFARHAGVAPVPISSGSRQRHRLDRGGNRQLNCALHRIAVVQARTARHAGAEYLASPQATGKSRQDALRCLKRQLARTVWKLLIAAEPSRPIPPRAALAIPIRQPPTTPVPAPSMMPCLT
ncbi:MAG TPA: transposase [Solirubrobacteraceae bacterium]|nr:transposase [Solirubrobacteraceae bacterium]